MFYASSLIDTGVSSSLICSGLLSHSLPGSPGSESLFFASPKKSNQKKGDPQSGPLRGSLKYSLETEILETSRPCRRRTSKIFNPSRLNISSPARTGWGIDSDSGEPSSQPPPGRRGRKSEFGFAFIPPPVLAGRRSAGGSGFKFLDVRRLRSRLVSKNSADFEHRKLPAAKRRDPDCGSPFLLLTLLLAKQKKSELLPGNPRQTTLGKSTPQKAQWQQEANK